MCTTLCAHNVAAFAELSGSTAASFSSSLLCFPGLLLPPFTNQETLPYESLKIQETRSPFMG